MNYINSKNDRGFMAVCGPSCCGKTELIFNMLLNNNFHLSFKQFFYFKYYQPKCQSLERELNIQFTKFSGFDPTSDLEKLSVGI